MPWFAKDFHEHGLRKTRIGRVDYPHLAGKKAEACRYYVMMQDPTHNYLLSPMSFVHPKGRGRKSWGSSEELLITEMLGHLFFLFVVHRIREVGGIQFRHIDIFVTLILPFWTVFSLFTPPSLPFSHHQSLVMALLFPYSYLWLRLSYQHLRMQVIWRLKEIFNYMCLLSCAIPWGSHTTTSEADIIILSITVYTRSPRPKEVHWWKHKQLYSCRAKALPCVSVHKLWNPLWGK